MVGEVQNVEELASEIRKGHAYVGLQIPPHFTRDLRAGHPAQVQMLIDGSNSTTALQALNTALGVALTQSVESLHARNRPPRRADRYPSANALQPDDAQPEFLRAGRDRHRSANRHNVRHCHGALCANANAARWSNCSLVRSAAGV